VTIKDHTAAFSSCLLASIAALGTAVGVGAWAETSNRRIPGTLVYAPPVGPGGITLEAGSADNAITISTDATTQEIEITDSAGAQVDMRPPFDDYADYCDQITKTRVRCDLFEPGGIRVLTRSGDDSVTVDSTEAGQIAIYGLAGVDGLQITHPIGRSKLKGGPGPDVILGGASTDKLDGGLADDTMRGKGGDDRLFGDAGADRMYGGQGSDVIDARDDGEDTSIDCGAGEDRVVLDRGVDPAPRSCEEVALG